GPSPRTRPSPAVSPDHVSDRSRPRLSPALHPRWLRLGDGPDLSLEVEPLHKKLLLLRQLRVPCWIGPGARDACQPGDFLIDALQLVPQPLELAGGHWRRGDRWRGGRLRLRRGGRSGLGGGARRGLPDFGRLVLDPLSIGRDAPARPGGDTDRVIFNRSSATKRTPPRSAARRAGPQPRR